MANPRHFNVLLGALCLGSMLVSSARAGEKLVVHEWGTFTSFQDEDGNAIGGINTDDEPVPDFVHRLAYNFLLTPTEAPPGFFQGAPSCHPDVTLRLETPVIYFHPAAGASIPAFNVHVAFHGGWLTEFYPDAEARAPGLDFAHPNRVFTEASKDNPVLAYFHNPIFGHLRKEAVGELTWTHLTLGSNDAAPKTEESVWLAPRAVAASPVKTERGESENFLFYRGVGNADAFLRVQQGSDGRTRLISPSASWAATRSPLPAPMWLVRVGNDGKCAFKTIAAWPEKGATVLTVVDSFAEGEESADNLPRLEEEMRVAITGAGLFADEAAALLTTWQKSYFQSPGLRLFYLCPRAETDALLPLSFSIPCDVTRVAIGRIELVTPEQRALLRTIAAGPAPELDRVRGRMQGNQGFFQHPENVAVFNDVMAGKKPIRLLGLDFPKLYVDYLELGRFRNALILDEEKRRPTAALHDFITKNYFQAYQPPEGTVNRQSLVGGSVVGGSLFLCGWLFRRSRRAAR
jgi:hypothetical protein